MAQNVLLKSAGLYSFPNLLSSIPQGALLTASNIVINRDNIAESRRGFKIYGSAMGSSVSNTAHQLLNYKGRLLRHYGASAGEKLEYDSNGTGTFTPFSLQLTGNTHTNTTIDNLSSTAQLFVGMFVSGTGIPSTATISSITSNTAIVISSATASSLTGITITFTFKIQEVSTGLRLKGIEQNGNFYFTSSEGTKKISVLSASGLSSAVITNSGGIKALDLKADINNNAGFLSPSSIIAYRIVWGIKDANQNLILGTPSERVIIENLNATLSKTVNLRITIPKGVTTSHFYQVYRTDTFSTVSTFAFTGNTTNLNTTISNIADTSSLVSGMVITGTGIPASTTITSISSGTSIVISNAATATNTGVTLTVVQSLDIDPGDEQALVYESNPSISDLTAGFLTVTDITPSSFRGANLYTNANSGEGIAQANDIPPLAKDITSFKNYTFFANTQTKQKLNLSLLSTSQLVSGTSTFTITDGTTTNTYTFKTTSLTGDTHTNTTVDNISTTAGLTAGLSLSGADFQDGTYIVRIISGTSIEISQSATASNVGTTIVFATESISAKQVALSQFATPSQQVDETARSLVRIINSQSTEITNAFYLSGVDEIPGAMNLEARKLDQIAFYLNVNSASSTGIEFTPNLPVSGSTVSSDNEVSPNRMYYSKFQQPEAVPILNFIDVGPKDKAIIRVLGLRDSLFILKEEGIYRLSGLSAPFQVYPFDFSTIIKAPDSAVVLNNLIYMFSNQGINTVSDSGVSIISRPIEDKLIPLLTTQYTNFTTATFGISYESDRAYYISTVKNTSDTYATQCLRFNTFTNTWTILDLSKRCGLVNPSNDKLYFGPINTNYIEEERKTFDRTDFADREFDLTILSGGVVGTSISLSSVSNISISDVLIQTQYLTINQFNRLLTKLDNDSLLSDSNYSSLLAASASINLSSQLDILITKIRDDSGRQSVVGFTANASYTALIGLGSASFSALQTNFNSLITLLNSDVGVSYSNYMSSSGTTFYELPVLSVNTSTSKITTNFEYPLIVGPVIVYNHINTELEFVPQFLTDVSITKQASEGTFIFEDSSFTQATVSYSSDLSADFESIDINGNGPGTFGNTIFGQGIFGGNGSGVPFRTYIPREKQRLRYLRCRFQHSYAREIFSLYGISISFNPVSQRGWR